MKEKLLMRYLLAISALFAALLFSGCVSMQTVHTEWFRGNTHTHTLKSDGDAAPEVVVKWYHDRNYNFLIITDQPPISSLHDALDLLTQKANS
jgi:hypothetical protein